MRFDVLTIFPEMFSGYLKEGILRRAIERGMVDVRLVQLRDFTDDPHRTTDDRPYGGGEGMVMKADPIHRALKSVDRIRGANRVILLSPRGRPFDQALAWELSRWEQLILICGRYEGVDERIKQTDMDMELSIGDFILSGGELGALVIMDAVSRLIPGVLGGEKSNLEDSFENGLLEYPQYTRPRVFEGLEVPEVLLSGNHEKIRRWRRRERLRITLKRRPELLERARLSEEDKTLLTDMMKASNGKAPKA